MPNISNAVVCLKKDLTDLPKSNNISLSQKDSPVIRNFNNGLLSVYLVDDGDQFIYVQNQDLETNRITADSLHVIGLQNLANIANEKLQVQQTEDIYAVFLDGNFESSLLLLDDLWDRALKSLIKNSYAVCVPARDILAFCDSESVEGIKNLRTLVERVCGGDHLISKEIYIRKNGNWIVMP